MLAPINKMGYGIASTGIFLALADGGDVALHAIGVFDPPVGKRGVAALERGRRLASSYDEDAPCLTIWHQKDLALRVGRGMHAGFPFFELRQLGADEKHPMSKLDRLFVASGWAAGVCEDNGLPRPVVAPLGVDRSVFNEDACTRRLDPDYTVFANVGKWEIRKGHDVLLSAFNAAFEPTDKVVLKMSSMCPFSGQSGNERWVKRYMSSKMGLCGKVEIEPGRFDTRERVAGFMASADAGVFPARAEAWNLDLLECMSCGLHCIATNYSGHTEYVNDRNCRLIDVDEFEEASDGQWFHGGGEWARLGGRQFDQLVGHMRDIHAAKQSGSLPRRDAAAVETAKAFGWDRTAEVIRGGLR